MSPSSHKVAVFTQRESFIDEYTWQRSGPGGW